MLSGEYESLKFKHKDLISRNKNLAGQMESLGQDSNRDRAKIQDLNRQVQYFKDLFEKEQTRCRECDYRIRCLENEEGLVAVTAKFMLVEQQLKEKDNDFGNAMRELEKKTLEANAWQRAARESNSEAKEIERKLREVQDTERVNSELRKKIKELEDQNSSLTEKCETLTSERDQARERCEEAEDRVEELESENEELLERNAWEIRAREEAEAAQEALQEDLSMKTRSCEDLEHRLTDAESDNLQLSHRIEQIEKVEKDEEDKQVEEVEEVEEDDKDKSQQISNLEHKIKLLEIIADYARHIRSRLFHTGLGGRTNREFIKAGNEAAHFGNIVVDVALFTLGFLDEGEKNFCEAKYAISPDFSIDAFVKDDALLQALINSGWTKVLNMHAYIDSECKYNISADLEEPLDRFRVLEAECLLRYEGWGAWVSGEEALRAFLDEHAEVKMQEMEGIVQRFRDVKRDRDSRPK